MDIAVISTFRFCSVNFLAVWYITDVTSFIAGVYIAVIVTLAFVIVAGVAIILLLLFLKRRKSRSVIEIHVHSIIMQSVNCPKSGTSRRETNVTVTLF